jgi:hypothetical protein
MILRDGELQAIGPADQLLRFANPSGQAAAPPAAATPPIAAPAQVSMRKQGHA